MPRPPRPRLVATRLTAMTALVALNLALSPDQPPAQAGEGQGPGPLSELGHHEQPDDPPGQISWPPDPLKPLRSSHYSRGPYVSVQANVNALGSNIPGDLDHDGDVNLQDFTIFTASFTGPR